MAVPQAPSPTCKESDYYQVLGVAYEATEEEIRHQYYSVVRTLHPDRRRPGDQGLERFHQVQSAWRCLSDPTRRLLYDLRNFGRSSLGEAGVSADAAGPAAEAKLRYLQKQQSSRDIQNMEVVLEKVLRRERKVRGILIRTAIYGDLRLREECLQQCISGQRTIQTSDLVGPVLDVTVPLQCLVEQHTIVLPGGASASKADLPGFYNPAPLQPDVELGLYALYEFKGNLHEVLVGDHETLSLPYRKHAIPAGREPRGPFSPANILLLRQRTPTALTEQTSKRDLDGRTGIVLAKGPGASTSEALAQAVAAYRLASLLPSPGPGEATPRELAAVAMGAGAALAVAVWLARRP